MSIKTLVNNVAEARARSARLVRTYLRLKLKQHLLVNGFGLRVRRERLFGYTVPIIDYRLFVYLFEEIFLRQDYRVEDVRDGATIIDGGSNIGMSVLFFKWLYPTARIRAFEPGTRTFECLRELVDVNGFSDVELHNCALADHSGPVTFYSDPDQPGSLRMSMTRSRLPKAEGTVAAVRLSEWITGPVDLLKLDIEGAEGAVIHELAAAGKLKFIRNMVIEYHHHIDSDRNCLSDLLGCVEQTASGISSAQASVHRSDRGLSRTC
jgi:FkbM family methyltransferase